MMVLLLENRHCHVLGGIEVVVEVVAIIQMRMSTRQQAAATANDKASDEAKVPLRHNAAKRIKPWKILVATVKRIDPGPCLLHDHQEGVLSAAAAPSPLLQLQEVDSLRRRASNDGTKTILPMRLVV
jgi:hypothetical protein